MLVSQKIAQNPRFLQTGMGDLKPVELRGDSEVSSDRRAHLVRGHFKNKNGKLFWWNSFIRNRNSALTDGTIVHDYCVH